MLAHNVHPVAAPHQGVQGKCPLAAALTVKSVNKIIYQDIMTGLADATMTCLCPAMNSGLAPPLCPPGSATSPHWHRCGAHRVSPRRNPAATLTASLSNPNPQAVNGRDGLQKVSCVWCHQCSKSGLAKKVMASIPHNRLVII